MSSSPSIINLSNSTPAAPTGNQNIQWQADSSDPRNVSASPQPATSSLLGVVKPDGTTITVSSAGVITAVGGGGGGGGGGGAAALLSGLIATPTLSSLAMTLNWNQSANFVAANAANGVLIKDSVGASGDNFEGIAQAYPSTPLDLKVLISTPTDNKNIFPTGGIGIAASLTGNFINFGWRNSGSGNPQIWVGNWNSPTSFNGFPLGVGPSTSNYLFLRFQDDGTTYTFSTSSDGNWWDVFYSVAKSSSFVPSPSYLGIVLNPAIGPIGFTVMSYQVNGVPAASSGGGAPLAISSGPDWPPAVPSAYDDEFTGSSLNTALWTNVINGVPNTIQVAKSILGILCAPHSGDNWTAITQPVPSSTPYTMTAKINPLFWNFNYCYGGLVIFDSSGRSVVIATGTSGPTLQVNHWNSTTSFNASVYSQSISVTNSYMRIHDDGTNLYFFISADGSAFTQFYQESRTAFLSAPAYMGIFCGLNDSAHPAALGCDWFRVTQP